MAAGSVGFCGFAEVFYWLGWRIVLYVNYEGRALSRGVFIRVLMDYIILPV